MMLQHCSLEKIAKQIQKYVPSKKQNLFFSIFLRGLFIENILKKTCVSFLKEFGWKRTYSKFNFYNLKLKIIRLLKKKKKTNKTPQSQIS